MEAVKETVTVKETIVDAPAKFGIAQIGQTTPSWATWIFRVFFYLSSATTVYLSMDSSIPAELALQIIKWLGIAVVLVHGISKMFGIDSRTYEVEAKDAFNQTPKL